MRRGARPRAAPVAEAPARRAGFAPDDDADDLRLLERVRAGDTEAFGLLVRRYSRRALSVAYR